MDIRVLSYFVSIVQHKSITRAAEALLISQPALSRQIKDLEEDLGATLLIRGSREIQVTEQGQYLYNRALEILNLVEKTEQTIRLDEEVAGTIALAAAESQSLDILAQTIKELTDRYPKLQFSSFSGNGDTVQEMVDNGLVDFGIVIGEVNHKKYDHLQLPNRDRWGVLMPKNHPLTKQTTLSHADVLPYPLIVSMQSNMDATVFAGLGDYRIVATYNLLYNAALLVEAGVGIALCLDGIVSRPDLTFVPFGHDNPDSLSLIWKRYASQPQTSKVFLETLKKRLATSQA